MKSLVFLLSAGAALFVLAGCGGKGKVNPTKLTLTVEPAGEEKAGDGADADSAADVETADPEATETEPAAEEGAPGGESGDNGAEAANNEVGGPSVSEPATDGSAGDSPVVADSGMDSPVSSSPATAEASPIMSGNADPGATGSSADGESGGRAAGAASGPASVTVESAEVLTEAVTVSGAGTAVKESAAQIDGTETSVQIQVSVGSGAEASADAEISITDIEDDAAPDGDAGEEPVRPEDESESAQGQATQGGEAPQAAGANGAESFAGGSPAESADEAGQTSANGDVAWPEKLTAVWACEKEGWKTFAYYLYEPGQDPGNVCELDFSSVSNRWSAASDANFCAEKLSRILIQREAEDYECHCVAPAENGQITFRGPGLSVFGLHFTCRPPSKEALSQIPPPQG